MARPPAWAMALAVSAAFVSLRLVTSTVAPFSANRIALALPIPALAPVTTAILSCKRPIAPPGKRLAHALPRRRLQIGRETVCTPVTNAHLVCRLLLENNKTHITTPQLSILLLQEQTNNT